MAWLGMGIGLGHRGGAAALYSFTGGTMPSGATLTRASGATRFNSAGTLVTEATNVARFDYSPVTLASRGLLYETVAATNVILESTPATALIWGSFGLVGLTLSQPGKASSTSATKLVPTASGSNSYRIRQTFVWTAAQYVVSCDVKASGQSWVRILFNDGVGPSAWFNISTGVVGTTQGTITSSIENIGGGFYRIAAIATAAVGAGLVEIYLTGGDGPANINYSPDGTSGVVIENIQVELASAATSRIITTTAAVTRAADSMDITIPAGVALIRFTHDDASYTEKVVTPSSTYTVPALLRNWITTVTARPSLPATLAPAGSATATPDILSGAPAYELNSVTRHYFAQETNWIDIGLANWFVNLGGSALAEAGSGFAMTVATSVTLASGTTIKVPWGGADTGSVASGATGYSDRTFVGIPAGTWVKFNVYRDLVGSDLGLFTQTASDTVGGEKLSSLNGGGNLTMVPATIVDNVGSSYRAPPAIIRGNVSGRSFALIGDSRTAGSQDAGATSDHGEIARALTNRWPYINLGVGNDRAEKFVASHTLRQALATQFTDIVQGYGVNDIATGRTSAQLLADNATIRGYFSGKTFWDYTLPPFGVGGTYTTLPGQTVYGNDAVRTTFNAALRAGISGVTVLEVADTIESSRDSGKFRVDLGALTTDGTHENALGNSTIGTAIAGSIT